MKSHTDLEQSKVLAKILPIESADMCYKCLDEDPYDIVIRPYTEWKEEYKGLLVNYEVDVIPCWSLAALLNVLPKKYYPIKDHETNLILGKPKDKWCVLYWDATGMQDGEQTLEDSPIDACYEMILKLHEQNIL